VHEKKMKGEKEALQPHHITRRTSETHESLIEGGTGRQTKKTQSDWLAMLQRADSPRWVCARGRSDFWVPANVQTTNFVHVPYFNN
jgi:hypothetical protein